jgi:hypothetical protein
MQVLGYFSSFDTMWAIRGKHPTEVSLLRTINSPSAIMEFSFFSKPTIEFTADSDFHSRLLDP